MQPWGRVPVPPQGIHRTVSLSSSTELNLPSIEDSVDGVFFIPERRLHWDFPSGPVVKTVLPLQGAWLQSLVQELRFHMLQCSQKKKKKKRNIREKVIV